MEKATSRRRKRYSGFVVRTLVWVEVKVSFQKNSPTLWIGVGL
jgi:hypothetical protein